MWQISTSHSYSKDLYVWGEDIREWWWTWLVCHFQIKNLGGNIFCESIDRRRVKLRINWYPFQMTFEPVYQYMDQFGSRVVMEYDKHYHCGLYPKTDYITCTMIYTEKEHQEIPYKGGNWRRYFPQDWIHYRDHDMHREGVSRNPLQGHNMWPNCSPDSHGKTAILS